MYAKSGECKDLDSAPCVPKVMPSELTARKFHTQTHTDTHLGLARTDEANLEHPNAMTDYSNRTESLRPMMETTAFFAYFGLAFPL